MVYWCFFYRIRCAFILYVQIYIRVVSPVECSTNKKHTWISMGFQVKLVPCILTKIIYFIVFFANSFLFTSYFNWRSSMINIITTIHAQATWVSRVEGICYLIRQITDRNDREYNMIHTVSLGTWMSAYLSTNGV